MDEENADALQHPMRESWLQCVDVTVPRTVHRAFPQFEDCRKGGLWTGSSIPGQMLFLFIFLIIGTLVSGCVSSSSCAVAQNKATALRHKQNILHHLLGNDCGSAIAELSARQSIYIDRFFHAHVYDHCGNPDKAIAGLLTPDRFYGQPSYHAGFEVLRLLDKHQLHLKYQDPLFANLMAIPFPFRADRRSPESTEKYRSEQLFHYLIFARTQLEDLAATDAGYLQWKLQALSSMSWEKT